MTRCKRSLDYLILKVLSNPGHCVHCNLRWSLLQDSLCCNGCGLKKSYLTCLALPAGALKYRLRISHENKQTKKSYKANN